MEDSLYLPPGFRFHPTDEEIITHYLLEKVTNPSFSAAAIAEANFNESEPWDLPRKAKMGEKEWYFFCQKDRKYPSGMRTNRATRTGYWKATGKDKEIFKGRGILVGMKKTLVFYKGRAPKGLKSNWVMHEYRLDGRHQYYNLSRSPKDELVVCKVYNKKESSINPTQEAQDRMNTFINDLLVDDTPPLPPLTDSHSYFNSSNAAMEEPQLVSANVFHQSVFFLQPVGSIPLSLFQQDRETMTRASSTSNGASMSASKETLMSKERITEASSAVSKQDIGKFQSYDNDPSSSEVQDLDLDGLLKYGLV